MQKKNEQLPPEQTSNVSEVVPQGASQPLAMVNNASGFREEFDGKNNISIFPDEVSDIIGDAGDPVENTAYARVCEPAANLSQSTNEDKDSRSEGYKACFSPEKPEEVREVVNSHFDFVGTKGTGNFIKTLANSTNRKSTDETSRDRVVMLEKKNSEPNFSQDILLGLPLDSLHSIASFLSLNDFCNFGLCSKSATKICRDIFRRVRMHGYRCATEVVTAWVRNGTWYRDHC